MPSLLVCCLALLQLAGTLSLVVGGFAPCSDPAVCSGAAGSCCTDIVNNGVTSTYCCPGTGNSFDYSTLQCSAFAQCGQSCSGLHLAFTTRAPRTAALSEA